MTDVRLVTNGKRELRPLIEAAIANELRLIEAGMKQAEKAIREFEKKYQMATQEFLSRYESDEIEEAMDFAEWVGEIRLLERLQEKAETLRDIRFEN
jgi:phage shock protein A